MREGDAKAHMLLVQGTLATVVGTLVTSWEHWQHIGHISNMATILGAFVTSSGTLVTVAGTLATPREAHWQQNRHIGNRKGTLAPACVGATDAPTTPKWWGLMDIFAHFEGHSELSRAHFTVSIGLSLSSKTQRFRLFL